MEKPTIFFSHSSQDSKILKQLKEELLEITGSTVNIFLSSDGKSIPLGTNWVSETVGALDETSLMFVFVSPNSLKSKWLYFESGYSFSKEAKVTPVGINGIDISKIAPPLSLLQGFNIDNHKKLNNIIAKINRNFDTSFNEAFTEETYQNIFAPHEGDTIKSIISVIQEIAINLNLPTGDDLDLKEYLDSEGIKYSISNNKLYLHGAELEFKDDPFFERNSSLIVSPTKFFKLEDLINEVVSLHNKSDQNITIDFVLDEKYSLLKDHKEISERLEGEIDLKESKYTYKNLIFAFHSASDTSFLTRYKNEEILGIECKAENFDILTIQQLIKLCLSEQLIFVKEGSY